VEEVVRDSSRLREPSWYRGEYSSSVSPRNSVSAESTTRGAAEPSAQAIKTGDGSRRDGATCSTKHSAGRTSKFPQ